MNKRISILVIVVGLLAGSCDDFLDVNTDPNNPTDVSPDLVLPVGLNYTATYVQQDRGLNHLGNMMMFTFGEANGFSWYDQEFRYSVNSTFYDQLFDNAYSRSLKQYHILEGQPDEYSYYQAIGMIMKAYHFQILVDLYGSIPYEEALNRGGNATPVYNEPDKIYDDLLVVLDNAVQKIDSTASAGSAEAVGADDTIFGGDMVQWAQFANTLKIRILTRLSDVKDASFISDQLATIQNGPYDYITDDVNINPGYIAEEEGKQNPYWNDLGKDASGNETLTYQATPATQFVIDFFTGTNDPRLDAIFEEPDTGHLGVNQGADNNTTDLAPGLVSNLKFEGGILKGPTMGSTILTLAEHHLNLAELAEKGFTTPQSAQNHYEAGIVASFNYLGLTTQDAVDYYDGQNDENVSWSNSTNKMDAIMTQKWLATMGINAEQAWFDYNRTDYPSAEPVGQASAPETAPTGFPISELASEDDRPVRLMYPQSEGTRNSENLPEQPDVFDIKIFWAN